MPDNNIVEFDPDNSHSKTVVKNKKEPNTANKNETESSLGSEKEKKS